MPSRSRHRLLAITLRAHTPRILGRRHRARAIVNNLDFLGLIIPITNLVTNLVLITDY